MRQLSVSRKCGPNVPPPPPYEPRETGKGKKGQRNGLRTGSRARAGGQLELLCLGRQREQAGERVRAGRDPRCPHLLTADLLGSPPPLPVGVWTSPPPSLFAHFASFSLGHSSAIRVNHSPPRLPSIPPISPRWLKAGQPHRSKTHTHTHTHQPWGPFFAVSLAF